MGLKSIGGTKPLPNKMTGVYLTGHGGYDKLQYRHDIPVPEPSPNEVLIRVSAAGINNTDINTRIGWYSKKVTDGTNKGSEGFNTINDEDATWSGEPLKFPRIQGADCCGIIVAVGTSVNSSRIGEMVLVRTMLRSCVDFRPYECWTYGSECDGAFAQYTKAPASDVFKVSSSLSCVELASVPCSYSTAEGMIHRAGVKKGEHVLITGASGGVGTAAIQLVKRRGATVTAISARPKLQEVQQLGADQVVERGMDIVKAVGHESVDVILDVVAGSGLNHMLDVLKKGGRYAVAGAIGGPIVQLDMRTVYLKDLYFFGCAFQDDVVFENLVSYIDKGEIQPRVGKVYPLGNIVEAQMDFIAKKYPGQLVLEIP